MIALVAVAGGLLTGWLTIGVLLALVVGGAIRRRDAQVPREPAAVPAEWSGAA